jgi:hypothetical protein
LRAIQLLDADYPDAVGLLRGIGLLALVLGVAQLAFHQEVIALLELGCVLAATAEDDQIVPLGAGDVLARFLVLEGGLGGEFENGEVAAVAGVDGGVFAEEACEDDFVHVHGVSPFLNSRIARVTPGEAKREAPAPKCQALHLRWVRRRWKTVTRRAAKRKQKSAEPQGAGLGPKQ